MIQLQDASLVRSLRQLLRLRLRLFSSASGVPGSTSNLFVHLRNCLGFLKKKNACFLINVLTSLPENEMSEFGRA